MLGVVQMWKLEGAWFMVSIPQDPVKKSASSRDQKGVCVDTLCIYTTKMLREREMLG